MAGNPDPWPMREATNNDSAHNHGFQTNSARDGQKIIRSFGMDRSTEVGSAEAERGTPRGLKGGPENLSHSLKGVTPNMTGQSRR